MRRLKTMLGVTLLEIMLVLAIAAMVVVVSIRYYQSATVSQQTNALMAQLQAISASADQLAQGSAGYGATAVNTTNMQALLGSTGLMTQWAQPITVTGTSATTYTVSVPATPPGVCASIRLKLQANTRFTSVTCASTTAPGTLSYTYNAAT
jgi:Tfp pilus assembly protein PilE